MMKEDLFKLFDTFVQIVLDMPITACKSMPCYLHHSVVSPEIKRRKRKMVKRLCWRDLVEKGRNL